MLPAFQFSSFTIPTKSLMIEKCDCVWVNIVLSLEHSHYALEVQNVSSNAGSKMCDLEQVALLQGVPVLTSQLRIIVMNTL